MADIHGIDRNNEADWNHNSYSDLSSSDEDLDEVGQGQSSGKMRGAPKRMAEEKLHEKRLKERARRNGMAKSIDQMRLIVPELMDAKKVYSQAKVVAIALQHIYELQRECGDLRQRLGMKPRDQEPRPVKGKRAQAAAQAAAAQAAANPNANSQSSSTTQAAPASPVIKREAPQMDSADERAKKRRRLDEPPVPIRAPVAAVQSSSTQPSPSAATMMATPPTAAALLALLPRVLPPAPASSSAPGAPVQMRLSNGSVEEGTLEAFGVDASAGHSSPSSLDEDDMMVADTPLTLSPRHEHDGSHDIYPAAFGFGASIPLWEEHDVDAHRHVGHPDSSVVELMLQSVLSGTN